jgi:hypothetical protein
MASALLDSDTPDAVRRRLPAVLEYCDSPLARDGLIAALTVEPLEIRARSAQALLKLTEDHPALAVPSAAPIAAAERQLRSDDRSRQAREFVFNLFALGFEREPMQIAARASLSKDAWVRGTSIEYLETVLPPQLLKELLPLLDSPPPSVTPREPAAARAELYKAGMTMTMSLAEVRRQLEAAAGEGEQGET